MGTSGFASCWTLPRESWLYPEMLLRRHLHREIENSRASC
jgi:hypothetical protein